VDENEELSIALGGYIAEECEKLKYFQIWWVQKNRENPEEFPLRLSSADWDEQRHFWNKHRENL
jgi:hypothetical protein